MDVARVVSELTATPIGIEEAKARNGVPHEPGFYAWWSIGHPISDVPAPPHPTEDGLFLFYVGISPSNERSSQTLRKRVVGSHMGGNTGGSTFRQTLASLLFESLGWEPVMRDRALLTKEDNDQLSEWQLENLRVRWAVRPRPWEIEDQVIDRLKPPLNLAFIEQVWEEAGTVQSILSEHLARVGIDVIPVLRFSRAETSWTALQGVKIVTPRGLRRMISKAKPVLSEDDLRVLVETLSERLAPSHSS